MQARRPVMLVVLDGWGWREDRADNAVRQARTPTFDRLWSAGPRAFLRTSGRDVGLPDGQMGNSEVGHLNIGAGRVVVQDLPRIADAIASGEIARAPALVDLIGKLKASGGTCHLIGLVSPGGVHSHQDHAVALAKILTDAGVPTLVHALTDGRDTPPQSAGDDLKRLVAALPPSVRVATVVGRYYGMDRDKRWERVKKAYDAMVEADGPRFPDPQAAIADAYAKKQFDEFILPSVIGDYRGMRDGDGVLCFNFRADRAREILGAMLDPDFTGLPASARRAFRRSGRHGAILRRTRQADGDNPAAADLPEHPGRGGRRRRPHAAPHGGDRESIRTSPISSTAAASSPTTARTASWCRRPRSRPTICSPRCRRRS